VKAIIALLSLALTLIVLPVRAAGLGNMYEDRLLESRVADYREVVQDNLYKVYLPRMAPAQRAALAGLQLDFPLRGPERSPFEFFASSGRRVTLPVMCIRFMSDLAIAQAWLAENGYSIDTVYEYIGMLKYKAPPPGGWPDPRTALHIPPNATDDPKVDQVSLQLLNQALNFVLLHELGHIIFQHPGYGAEVPREQARANEAAADQFALDVMRRLGQPPIGVHFFFAAASHYVGSRADFASDADYANWLSHDTHPLSSQRMVAVAASMRNNAAEFAKLQNDVGKTTQTIKYFAGQVDEIARLLEDPKLQKLIANRATSTTLAGLAPRRAR
jgi:hypothetical protein